MPAPSPDPLQGLHLATLESLPTPVTWPSSEDAGRPSPRSWPGAQSAQVTAAQSAADHGGAALGSPASPKPRGQAACRHLHRCTDKHPGATGAEPPGQSQTKPPPGGACNPKQKGFQLMLHRSERHNRFPNKTQISQRHFKVGPPLSLEAEALGRESHAGGTPALLCPPASPPLPPSDHLSPGDTQELRPQDHPGHLCRAGARSGVGGPDCDGPQAQGQA